MKRWWLDYLNKMSFPVVAIAIFKLSDLLPVYWPDVRSNKFPGAMNKKQFLQRYQRALLDENVLELVLVGRFRACPQHRTLSTSRWDELCWSWYTWSVKQAIQLRLKPDNMATIKKHNNGRVAKKKQTTERISGQNSEDWDAPVTAVENQPITVDHGAL